MWQKNQGGGEQKPTSVKEYGDLFCNMTCYLLFG
jgi:hypothetical protein